MAIKLQDKTNVLAPGGAYPYGNIIDNPGDGSGTPVNKQVYADFHQFFAKLLDAAGVTASGLPDNLTNGFDYFQALWQLVNKNAATDLITGLLGTYTTNDLIVLYGCVVTANVPGTSSITAGAIFYNGNFYKVAAQPSISSPANTLVFKIDLTVQPNIIYLANAMTGTGIANFNGASVKSFVPIPNKADKSQFLLESVNAAGPTSFSPTADLTVLTLTPSASKSSAKMKYTFQGYTSNTNGGARTAKINKNGSTIASAVYAVDNAQQMSFCLVWIDTYAANDVITATIAATTNGAEINNYILICEAMDAIQ